MFPANVQMLATLLFKYGLQVLWRVCDQGDTALQWH